MSYRTIVFIFAILITQRTTAQLFGDQQIISTQADVAWAVYAADLDNDGDMDIISASTGDDKIAWYENLGGGNFGMEQIITSDCEHARTVYAADLDGDGDMDVLSASLISYERVVWYENQGGGQFGPEQIISTLVDNPAAVYAADMDEDGDIDVLSASIYDDKIALYKNLGGGEFGSQQIITLSANSANDVHAADLDGDGDIDILSASGLDDKIAWYENLGGGFFGTQQIISVLADFAMSVHTADLDEDGDVDVLSASYGDDKIAWYENFGGGQFGAQQIITTQTDAANTVHSADLDLDGDMDVISASSSSHVYKVAWYENLGEGLFGTQQIITLEAQQVHCAYVSDLDGDNNMDIISASALDDKIAWYENMTFIPGCIDPGACNYDPIAMEDDGTCCYSSCGCTDPAALNYEQNATCENGSCFYIEGCTNELANNYNPAAVVENGTCELSITVTVFFDENENGVMDGAEYGLPFQTVLIEESGLTYLTNDEGNFIANIGQAQSIEFLLHANPDFPFTTTPNPVLFITETAQSTQILFGVSNQVPNFEVCVDLYPNGNGFLCNAYSNHNICFRNMGNVPIDGIIEIEYDELFQGYLEVTPIDSVIGNTVYMSYENLLPGQMFFYDIALLTPTVDHIGESITSYAKVYGYFDGNLVAYGQKELTTEITCAYDPNDKQAFPLGYTDEHWLLPATEQEFLIRFQNTGNAPAQNIRIQDTLDVNFNIESFRLMANSHSVMTTIDPATRLIDFYFENIQLPDSVNNEPDSHGLVSYKISPLYNLPAGTVLENTAYIYFDNNDPIVTNTTWTTIHECGGEAAFESATALVCNEQQVNFESSYEFVENYSWQIDGVAAGVDSELLLSSIDQADYEVTLTATNPLCTETITLDYEVLDIELVDPCLADFTCDGNRDTGDLLEFLNEYGCQGACEADLDENALVNFIDLYLFLSLYGQSCWD